MLTPVHNKTLGKLEIWRKFSVDKEHLPKAYINFDSWQWNIRSAGTKFSNNTRLLMSTAKIQHCTKGSNQWNLLQGQRVGDLKLKRKMQYCSHSWTISINLENSLYNLPIIKTENRVYQVARYNYIPRSDWGWLEFWLGLEHTGLEIKTRRKRRDKHKGESKRVSHKKGARWTRHQTDGLEGPGEDLGTKLLKVGRQEETTLTRRGEQMQHDTERGGQCWEALRAKRLGRQGRKVGCMTWARRTRNLIISGGRDWNGKIRGSFPVIVFFRGISVLILWKGVTSRNWELLQQLSHYCWHHPVSERPLWDTEKQMWFVVTRGAV